MCEIVSGDTDTGIRDIDQGAIAVATYVNVDRATFWRVFKSIFDKIVENLAHKIDIDESIDDLLHSTVFTEGNRLTGTKIKTDLGFFSSLHIIV